MLKELLLTQFINNKYWNVKRVSKLAIECHFLTKILFNFCSINTYKLLILWYCGRNCSFLWENVKANYELCWIEVALLERMFSTLSPFIGTKSLSMSDTWTKCSSPWSSLKNPCPLDRQKYVTVPFCVSLWHLKIFYYF